MDIAVFTNDIGLYDLGVIYIYITAQSESLAIGKNGKVIGSNPQRAHKRGCKVYEWSRTVVGEVKPLAGKSFPIYVTIEQIFVVIERDVIDKSVG